VSRFLVFSLSLMLLVGCDQTPTGRDQLALMPDTMMADFGRQTFLQMQQHIPVSDDEAANQEVQCVARQLLTHVGNRFPGDPIPQSWEIVVFADPSPNAFALPGGKIGVNEGLLAVATSDDQLAAVIGHEVGHAYYPGTWHGRTSGDCPAVQPGPRGRGGFDGAGTDGQRRL